MRTLRQWITEPKEKISLEEVISKEKVTLLELAKENEVEVEFAEGWYMISIYGIPYAQANDKGLAEKFISELVA